MYVLLCMCACVCARACAGLTSHLLSIREFSLKTRQQIPRSDSLHIAYPLLVPFGGYNSNDFDSSVNSPYTDLCV